MGFTYKSYNFIDKDPIIDEVRSVFQESGVNYSWIEEHSGVCRMTLKNWFTGETRRPQAATINAVLRSLGFKLTVAPYEAQEKIKIVPAMPQPVERERVSNPARHVVQMHKYRRK